MTDDDGPGRGRIPARDSGCVRAKAGFVSIGLVDPRATPYAIPVSRLRNVVERMARLTGSELVRRNFYSPIPYDTPDEVYDRRSDLAGIEFDTGEQIEWLERMARHAEGWTAPSDLMFSSVDAEVLYGVIRELQPRRVIELGSGISSGIIRQALGRPHEIYDPVANDRTDLRTHRVRATDISLDVFQTLGEGDVLFVDTTHTVKTGGDVNRIILDIFPTLRPGVVVHVHDIFLPFEYSRAWAKEGRLWAEQYLLQAFLIGNPSWEVLCGNFAATRDFPERVKAAVPRYVPPKRPGSFWMRRRS